MKRTEPLAGGCSLSSCVGGPGTTNPLSQPRGARGTREDPARGRDAGAQLRALMPAGPLLASAPSPRAGASTSPSPAAAHVAPGPATPLCPNAPRTNPTSTKRALIRSPSPPPRTRGPSTRLSQMSRRQWGRSFSGEDARLPDASLSREAPAPPRVPGCEAAPRRPPPGPLLNPGPSPSCAFHLRRQDAPRGQQARGGQLHPRSPTNPSARTRLQASRERKMPSRGRPRAPAADCLADVEDV